MEIFVKNLELFAYHGVHPVEQKTGNRFIVNIAASFDTPEKEILSDNLSATVDYTQLIKIATEEMQKPVNLLENVMCRIGNRIMQELPMVQKVHVEIIKQHPPVNQKINSGVGVRETFIRK